MNFPENAATDCDNVEFTIVGDTLRRLGMDIEANGSQLAYTTINKATNTYKWDNVGGDGSTQLVVVQIGSTLHFFSVTDASPASPLSNHKLSSTVSLNDFLVTGLTFDSSIACEFADGNGYLFVYHPNCDPFYCTYNGGVITGNVITLKVRDFIGVPEAGVDDNIRASSLTDSHKYNLQNQGWTSQNPWTATDTTSNITVKTGSAAFTVASGITGIVATQYVLMRPYFITTNVPAPEWMYGLVTSYVGTTLTINVTGINGGSLWGPPEGYYWKITPVSSGYITTWNTALGNYPSNADQWWRFKTTSNVFDPATTVTNISIGLGAAPKGHYLIDAFNQQRDLVSGVTSITDITTTSRPTNGCWFQGRVWYTGINSSQAATGTAPSTTWTENIYFSQVVQKVDDFGKCYQTNDPTAEDLFDLLPTDGGVIVIQGSGPIYKLFPIQNGMLVFAANGIWFITGSQGIGFTANDYTITKISNIQSISTSSYVNVMGLPYFWNEEGIYQVAPAQQGGLGVNPITVGTILSFYEDIPLESKKHVRAAYHPIDYVIQWIYRSTNSSSIDEKYTFDKVLNYNVYNKAFYPYTVDSTQGKIKAIVYITGPGGSSSVEAGFKYLCGVSDNVSFSDLHDTNYVDWATVTAVDYTSYFITGYKLHGQAQRRFQIPYVYMYNRQIDDYSSYLIQFRWDYATSGDTGRWSTTQFVENNAANYSVISRRHRVRGHGLVLQMKLSSVSGQPFDVIGWSMYETQNTGV